MFRANVFIRTMLEYVCVTWFALLFELNPLLLDILGKEKSAELPLEGGLVKWPPLALLVDQDRE